MSKELIINYIIETIVEQYGFTQKKATEILNSVEFEKLYAKMPDYIQHYDTEYWAKEIYETYLNNIILEKSITRSYNCKTITLTPPKDFIYKNVQSDDEPKYKNYPISIDSCIADEIQELWDKDIRTTGCCCGHGINLGFIQVENEDIPKMEAMGYEHYLYSNKFGGVARKDGFIPKTGYKHNIDKTKPYVERYKD